MRCLKGAFAAAVLAVTAGACGGQPFPPRTPVTVGLALEAGGLGDLSYNDAAIAGLDRIRTNAEVRVTQAAARPGEPEADRETRLRTLARDNGMVIALGAAYTHAVERAAKAFPKVKFLVIDPERCKVRGANVAGACFRTEQGAYLAGAAAALKTRSNTIGFVGGTGYPDVGRFQAGYEAGARAVRPGIRILPARYVTTPEEAGKAAREQLDAGADIIFQAAGRSGAAVADTVRAAGRQVIGSGSDQYHLPALAGARDHVLTSALKRVDVAVHTFFLLSADGFRPGPETYDLKLDGVGYSTSGGRLDDVTTRLDALRLAIIDREVKVPTSP
ncbi:BMP family lipoprotein [Actinomadura kijaniata]|uniref:BMP family lipoprotein n=1 Tax=Actinomadura kijaniata TaxID=46161 RepID=UPI003F1ABF56